MSSFNLPAKKQAGPINVKTFFGTNLSQPHSFPAGEIDATIAFFSKRGFDKVSANSVAIILLSQARKENVNVFTLMDTLKALTEVQLSQVVAQVLNSSRDSTSMLGYRTATSTNTYEARNILI